MTEPRPQTPYFDPARRSWVLSRYSDVSKALAESRLWPFAPDSAEAREDSTEGAKLADQSAHHQLRMETLSALQRARIAEWRDGAEPSAQIIADSLPSSRAVDVIEEFARPWSLGLAFTVTGAESRDAQRLVTWAETVSQSTADPQNLDLKRAAPAAEANLKAALAHSSLPMAGPAFVALSQTLPALLACAWLILLAHEEEVEQLRENNSLMPKAIDELLRAANLTRVLHRRAIEDVRIGEVTIRRGERVELMIATANHDPEYFPEPDRLIFSRPACAQFAMGAGPHSCVAAALIRMAMEVTTTALVENFIPAEKSAPVEWRGGSGFRWPAHVFALKRALSKTIVDAR
jgi:cytochrome P450